MMGVGDQDGERTLQQVVERLPIGSGTLPTVEGELFIRDVVAKCDRNGRLDLLAQIARLGGEREC